MTREVPLTQGFVTIVDDDKYDLVTQWKWCVLVGSKVNYARRGQWDPATRKVRSVQLHRFLMGDPPGITVDHRNGDGLDNRMSNLRLATKQQQSQNRGFRVDNKSGHTGVYWFHCGNGTWKWRATIKVGGKRVSLGLYDRVEDAAAAYEVAAEKYFGEFRRQQ